MPTLTLQESRRPEFRDRDGLEVIVKAEDSVIVYTLDWSDQLASSETIASATWTDDGVTATGETISGRTTYATISGTSGETTVQIVTSLSRTLVRTIRFVDTGDRS